MTGAIVSRIVCTIHALSSQCCPGKIMINRADATIIVCLNKFRSPLSSKIHSL